MLDETKAMWHRLRQSPPGRRFRHFHAEYSHQYTGWKRCALIAAAGLSFVIGVILAFIPGPAVVFFALTCAMVAALSSRVARWFDAIEVLGRRRVLRYLRQRARRKRAAADTSTHGRDTYMHHASETRHKA